MGLEQVDAALQYLASVLDWVDGDIARLTAGHLAALVQPAQSDARRRIGIELVGGLVVFGRVVSGTDGARLGCNTPDSGVALSGVICGSGSRGTFPEPPQRLQSLSRNPSPPHYGHKRRPDPLHVTHMRLVFEPMRPGRRPAPLQVVQV